MNFGIRSVEARGFRVSMTNNRIEVGRAFIYLMYNDLRDQPFALMEDVYVDKLYRSEEVWAELIEQVVKLAQQANCYKLLAISRASGSEIHELYTIWPVTSGGR